MLRAPLLPVLLRRFTCACVVALQAQLHQFPKACLPDPLTSLHRWHAAPALQHLMEGASSLYMCSSQCHLPSPCSPT